MLDKSEYRDIVRELVNIGAGKAGQMLNQLFSSHIILSIPVVELFDDTKTTDIKNLFSSETRYYSIEMDFEGEDLNGSAMLLFKYDQVGILTGALMNNPGQEPPDQILINSALSEIGNIVINAFIGSISNLLEENITFFVPRCNDAMDTAALKAHYTNFSNAIVAQTVFSFERLQADGYSIIYLKDNRFLDRLYMKIDTKAL